MPSLEGAPGGLRHLQLFLNFTTSLQTLRYYNCVDWVPAPHQRRFPSFLRSIKDTVL